jgi:hypothetical protein
MSSESGQNSGTALAAQAQQDRVVKLYNDNEVKIRKIKAFIATYQLDKDRRERELNDALHLPFETKKIHALRIEHLSNVLAECHACVLTLEDFETEFRTDWKEMRKAKVEQREEFINKRVQRVEQSIALLTARVRTCNEWLEKVDDQIEKSAPSEDQEKSEGTEEPGEYMEGGETNVPTE